MEGVGGHYVDYFLHFWSLANKRGKLKPWYFIKIHSEIGALSHIVIQRRPNTGEIVMKFAVYMVHNICQGMDGGQRPLSWLLL